MKELLKDQQIQGQHPKEEITITIIPVVILLLVHHQGPLEQVVAVILVVEGFILVPKMILHTIKRFKRKGFVKGTLLEIPVQLGLESILQPMIQGQVSFTTNLDKHHKSLIKEGACFVVT